MRSHNRRIRGLAALTFPRTLYCLPIKETTLLKQNRILDWNFFFSIKSRPVVHLQDSRGHCVQKPVVSPYCLFHCAYMLRVCGLTLRLIFFRDSRKSESFMFRTSLAAMFFTCSGRSSLIGPRAASLANEVRSLPE